MAVSKVLVVDDCRMTTLLIRHILNREGIPSDAAGTGPEAVEKALKKDYELILLDIVLPGFDGVEVAKRIAQERGESSPEIVLLTSLGEDFRQTMLAESGAREILFKPIIPSKIVAAARRLL